MVNLNLLAPKCKAFQLDTYKVFTTLFVRQKGQAWPIPCHLTLWGNKYGTKSFFTVKKIKRCVYYQEN
jgi:hypothetical protein